MGTAAEGQDCSQVLERLYEYLDGETDGKSTAQIKQHLAECGPCLSQLDIERAVRTVLRRSCACQSAPERLRRQIIAQITTLTVQTGTTASGARRVATTTTVRTYRQEP